MNCTEAGARRIELLVSGGLEYREETGLGRTETSGLPAVADPSRLRCLVHSCSPRDRGRESGRRHRLHPLACLIAAIFLAIAPAGFAWSNRGHRTINLVAAESLPPDVPPFLRTPAAVREIAFLGPEPDRWAAGSREPELSRMSAPDHVFRIELAERLLSIPRDRDRFDRELRAAGLTARQVGTLPWAAEEVFQRLEAAFHTYRILNGEFPPASYADMEPLTRADLPDVEASAIFYCGWLGHYIGDGSMPLHDTVNVAGWKTANPHGYTTRGDVHHRLEVAADNAIASGAITPAAILAQEKSARHLHDPFADILFFLEQVQGNSAQVYQFEKSGAIEGAGTPALQHFVEARMTEGADMLRNLIYTAWLDSASISAPEGAGPVALPSR